MKGVPQRVNCKKDTRWLLTVETYFNYHFHIFYLGFLHEISESQKNSNNHLWSIHFVFKCQFESSPNVPNETIWWKVSGHTMVVLSFFWDSSQKLWEKVSVQVSRYFHLSVLWEYYRYLVIHFSYFKYLQIVPIYYKTTLRKTGKIAVICLKIWTVIMGLCTLFFDLQS